MSETVPVWVLVHKRFQMVAMQNLTPTSCEFTEVLTNAAKFPNEWAAREMARRIYPMGGLTAKLEYCNPAYATFTERKVGFSPALAAPFKDIYAQFAETLAPPPPVEPKVMRDVLRAWASVIPNGPFVGQLHHMAEAMSDDELRCLDRAIYLLRDASR